MSSGMAQASRLRAILVTFKVNVSSKAKNEISVALVSHLKAKFAMCAARMCLAAAACCWRHT